MKKSFSIMLFISIIILYSCSKEDGGLMDPDGKKNSTIKNGLLIDPNGNPANTNRSGDNGLLIDPNGKPSQTANAGGDKARPMVDPWGKK
jgi:hypothetical protein